MRWWPRTVRWQLILWLMLLEALSVALFAVLLARVEGREVRKRTVDRLAHEATSISLEAEDAYRQQRPELVLPSLRLVRAAPSVGRVCITDTAGNVLFGSDGNSSQFRLDPAETAQISQVKAHQPRVFAFGHHQWEGVEAIYEGNKLRGYAWVENDNSRTGNRSTRFCEALFHSD